MERRPTAQRRSSRWEKERRVLHGLIELYLKTGKPVGSQTLQEELFADISSATIRNYFASLEADGYLKQQHLSGGRIPQAKAFLDYAHFCHDRLKKEPLPQIEALPLSGSITSNEVVSFLQQAGDGVSQRASMAVAMSAPRFDHDAITDITFVFLDVQRALAVITTEFGLVHTALLYSQQPLSHALVRKADRFARSRLFREHLEPDLFEGEELERVRKLYQEAVASYFVSYSSVSQEDLWRTGFSRLLKRPEFEDPQAISAPLSLFENVNALRGLSRDAVRADQIRFWVGEELVPYAVGEPNCAVVAVPYRVGAHPVGALIVVGSMKVMYYELFCLLECAANHISSVLTNCLHHHRMTYRVPETQAIVVKGVQQLALDVYKGPDQPQESV
jgi:heat-inducible transcriptional repressor